LSTQEVCFVSFDLPPWQVQWAVLWCLATPVVLLFMRWLPLAAAQRFNATGSIVLGSYLAVVLWWGSQSSDVISALAGLALIASALIITLGIWGLLTRGYSVAVVVALARRGGRASLVELAHASSGGRGLRWLTEKRLRGLQSFGIVAVSERWVTVTPGMGGTALQAYRIFRRCFPLREYG
jgi:hypothetical protein